MLHPTAADERAKVWLPDVVPRLAGDSIPDLCYDQVSSRGKRGDENGGANEVADQPVVEVIGRKAGEHAYTQAERYRLSALAGHLGARLRRVTDSAIA